MGANRRSDDGTRLCFTIEILFPLFRGFRHKIMVHADRTHNEFQLINPNMMFLKNLGF